MGFSIDTRTLKPGDVFIPIKGENFDGHEFIQEALKKGASKILDEDIREVAKKYRKKLNCQVIAVVGSYGKTTTKDYLKALFSQSYRVVSTVENQNNEIGVALTVLAADYQTEVLIVELGIRKPKQMKPLLQMLRPDTIVFTGVGMAHIEFFDSVKAIAVEKAQVFQKALVWEKKRKAYIATGHAHVDYLSQRAQRLGFEVFLYGGAEALAQPLSLLYEIGRHTGFSAEQIESAIQSYQSSAHRLKIFTNSKQVKVIDDVYNANPEAMLAALGYLCKFKGRKLCVLGEMLELGAHAKTAHQQVVQWIEESEIAVAFLIGEAYQGASVDSDTCVFLEDKAAAQSLLLAELKAEDTVLLKASRGIGLESIVEALNL